ncbi:hypothetical protein EDB92DRAFT_561290 [Lactarius akahatsu]|uniref:F-box domain-containing protein n=1 Tax=Lactarius akahatsu TaxID=416441 RepID=A0AAD4QE77_9AGAM|nr:hypothetical protein EDB92DRAFT_561290 [Lactarius akahatsu]
MDANSREYQRQAIDAQIESLEESIRTLRLRRNTLAPVLSLPTEVIDTIFSFLRSRVTLPASELGDGLVWLRVAHALSPMARDCTQSTPLLESRRFHRYQFSRVPSGLWDDARFSAFQKELQVHASHICHLRISAESCQFHRIFEGLVSPAPILESLSLFGRASH